MYLLQNLLPMFPLFGMLWGACCCLTCANCSSGTATQQYQIEISGLANGVCTSCASFNGTWVVDFLGDGELPFLSCRWWGSIGTTLAGCSSFDGIYFDIGKVGVDPTHYYYEVGPYRSSDNVVGLDFFLKDKGASPPNCNLSSESVTQNGTAVCDATSATCTIDSV